MVNGIHQKLLYMYIACATFQAILCLLAIQNGTLNSCRNSNYIITRHWNVFTGSQSKRSAPYCNEIETFIETFILR